MRARYWVLVAVLLGLFIAGFVAGEDARGGLIRNDLYRFHGPAIFAFRERPWASVLPDYSSATMPLFHILESFNPLLGHDTAFRAVNVIVALITAAAFVVALLRRFPRECGLRSPAVLIGAAMLLSPYFTAEAYWVTTDILPILLVILSAILLVPVQDVSESGGKAVGAGPAEKLGPFPIIIGAAVLSWGAFYCRQTYIFAPLYAGALLFARYRRQRWFTAATFALLALPAVYLVCLWKGMNPPRFQTHETISQDAIVAPFSMIFIYALPFIAEALFAGGRDISRWSAPAKRYRPWLIAGWFLFIGLFWNYRFDQQNRGGGIASRLLSSFGRPGALLFLSFAYLGLLAVVWLWRGSGWRPRLILVLFLLPAVALSRLFERYYDPVLIVLFFLFIERTLVRPFLKVRMALLLMAFNAMLLAGSLIYSGRENPVFLPIDSSAHPWDGTPLQGKVR